MKHREQSALSFAISAVLMGVLSIQSAHADDDDDNGDRAACAGLPNHATLQNALRTVLAEGAGIGDNGGLGNEMWASVVNRDGTVCAVARSGDKPGDQWPGSRVISAQKANTGNAFSLNSLSLSSGNLYGTVLPSDDHLDMTGGAGGSLLGLQFSNPVDTRVAYRGNARKFGAKNDPMLGGRIGGINVFGGGLALYDRQQGIVGGLGVSGDTSCTDHIVAWKIRDLLELDDVPAGVAPGATNGTDNLIINDAPIPNSFQHPSCLNLGTQIDDLPDDFPIASEE